MTAATMDHLELWTQIRDDLARARNTLPKDAANSEIILQYEEFLRDNELELACDMLESYAENQNVGREFWLALQCAAAKMKLSDRALRYERLASIS